MADTIALLVLAVALWFWNDSARTREQTLKYCRDACRDLDIQLLEETVALAHTRLKRDARGHLLVHRWYRFEFSIDGADRHPGAASVAGRIIEFVRFEHPKGPLIIPSSRLHEIA